MNTLRIVGQNEISPKTLYVRYDDVRTGRWLGESQRWAWEGGDALVVVTGHCPNVTCYTVIRVGDKIEVVEGSVWHALKAMGFDPDKEFVVA